MESERQRTHQAELKLRDMGREAKKWESTCSSTQRELKKQGEELKSVRKAYREKLSSLLKVHEDPGVLIPEGIVDPEDAMDSEGDKTQTPAEVTDPLSDLLISYNNSEENMLQALSDSNSQVARLERALEALHDQFRSCLDQLSEMQRNEGAVPHFPSHPVFFLISFFLVSFVCIQFAPTISNSLLKNSHN